MEEGRKIELLRACVEMLAAERQAWGYGAPAQAPGVLARGDAEELFGLFRALVNVRDARPASEGFLAAQDELLRGLIAERGIHGLDEALSSSLDGRLALWRGDITTLAADCIVNAANSQMLGCWRPGHHCIDNAIHTFAGVQLRLECARLMGEQGHEEPTGSCKVTPAFNLPARLVAHTVGPIAGGAPTAEHERQLASCYEHCLDAAAGAGAESIAFCCISTGVFGFPQEPAAQVAVGAVRRWLAEHPGARMQVVFNVFLERDEAIYRELLGL